MLRCSNGKKPENNGIILPQIRLDHATQSLFSWQNNRREQVTIE